MDRMKSRSNPLAAMAGGIALAALVSGPATAQGVDRYQFLQLEKQVKDLNAEVSRLRSAVGSGSMLQRLDGLEAEITRLTGQIEELQFAVRRHDAEAEKKFLDLEYRIIELEGGDPSILFQNEDSQDQGAVAPSIAPASTEPSGGTLGVIRSTAEVQGGERAAFDAGVAAVQSGRAGEGAQLLQGFLSDYPNSPLVGDANFWLGESYFASGDYQAAANRYLDGATLNPGASKAGESLLQFGVTLSLLGNTDVACETFQEVRQRFGGAPNIAARAETEARSAGCG